MELLTSLLNILNEMSPYILLGLLIAGLMHAFIPSRVFARHLSGGGFKAVVKSAMLGVPLPLCSCGVLPTAISMRRSGASKAASTSFLVATPQTGVDSIAATWSLLGPAFACIRPIAALVTALFGGMAVGAAEGENKSVECSDGQCNVTATEFREPRQAFFTKCVSALKYGFIDLMGSIGTWLVIGLIIAAIITVYVPADFLSGFSSSPLLTMIGVLIVAVPMYVCATGSIPIALSLMLKGLTPGTAFVLLMAGPAVNFASFTLISREMGRRTALVYLLSIITGAIAFGLFIDYILPAGWFDVSASAAACCHGMNFEIFPTVCSAILVSLLIITFIMNHKHNKVENMSKEFKIEGMNCPHCRASVEKAISQVAGVEQVDVSLAEGRAVISGDVDDNAILAAVSAAGFTATPL